VQRAYEAGLIVVASAGNRGKLEDGTPVLGGVTVPGSCPHSITVGALDTKGTPFRSDDEITTYSSKGPTQYDHLVKPDLVAPGHHIRSLLAPGSTIATRYPEKVIGSGRQARLELSGTSMAAAVVSGAAALVADATPRLSPLGARFALEYGAERRAEEPLLVAGAGRLNILASLALRYRETAPAIVGETQTSSQLAYVGISAGTVVWGNGDGIIWGDSADGIIWGNDDGIIWGDSADGIIWGNDDGIIWGDSMDFTIS
jgi:serine protease AprX